MNITAWETPFRLLVFSGIPLLAALVLVVIAQVLQPLEARHAPARTLRRLVSRAAVTTALLAVAFLVIAGAMEWFGERTVTGWAPTAILVFLGITFYAWGHCAWRLRGEPRIGPRCPKCGYDLAGLPLPGRPPCPECGRRLPNSERRLFRKPVRRWATRLGVVLALVGLVGPPMLTIYRRGWTASAPDWLLLRLLVSNIETQPVLVEMQERRLSLALVAPHWTRDLMHSFADEYDAASATGKRPPAIYNRFYQLYHGATDAETRRLAESWIASPSAGRRFTASGMMTVEGFFPTEDRLRLLRPLLADADDGVRTNAVRALTFDASLPLDELLAFQRSERGKLWAMEVDAALRHYESPEAIDARMRLAADSTNGWADHVTWGLMLAGFDIANESYHDGTFRRLAHAQAALPTARTAWTRSFAAQQFRQVYKRLAERAAAKPGTEGEDPVTAAWCLAALKSYATTIPNGASAPIAAPVLAGIDELLKSEPAGAYRERLLKVREAIAPGDGASAPSPGEEMGRDR